MLLTYKPRSWQSAEIIAKQQDQDIQYSISHHQPHSSFYEENLFGFEYQIIATSVALFLQDVDVTLLDLMTISVTKSVVFARVNLEERALHVQAVIWITLTTALLAV